MNLCVGKNLEKGGGRPAKILFGSVEMACDSEAGDLERLAAVVCGLRPPLRRFGGSL